MREIKALLIYVVGAAGLLIGIAVAANWAVNPSQKPGEQVTARQQTTGVTADSEAQARQLVDDPSRQPVWIEPTRRYSYSTGHVPVVKVEPAAPPVVPSAPERRVLERTTVTKPSRPAVAAHRPARRVYRTAEQAPPMQMQILPLQHQAPN